MKSLLSNNQLGKLILGALLCILSSAATSQTITTIAGNGFSGYTGDGGPAISAEFHAPSWQVFDNAGNLYISDEFNNVIRKINTTGTISTYAGDGTYLGDGGLADTLAKLISPLGLAFDSAGNLYISDQMQNRVRKVDPSGIITTIAGNGIGTFAGDGGPAVAASLLYPCALAFDPAGNLYISDEGNERIRKVNTAGIISTVVGGGTSLANGIAATASKLSINIGILIDASGNLMVADGGDAIVRKVTAVGGVIDGSCIINTIAGNGEYISSGDGGPATNASIISPQGLCFDQCDNLLISDFFGNTIRKVNPLGIITTIAGTGTAGFSGDGGDALVAELNGPSGIILDNLDNLIVSDFDNNRIRKISKITPTPVYTLGAYYPLIVCENAQPYAIDAMLSITDNDPGNMDSWQVARAAAHGTVAGGVYDTTYFTEVIKPVGFSYQPIPGYSGRDTFSIMVTDCGVSDTIRFDVTITPDGIWGPSGICNGSVISLTDSSVGGTWKSSNTTVATIGAGTGLLTSLDSGVVIITDSLGTQCVATKTITVNPAPTAVIGATHLCLGLTTTLTDAPTGGTWSSSNDTIATVDPTGSVTSIHSGTDTIWYSIGSCRSLDVMTINTAPAAISGASHVCTGTPITLTDAVTGGTWTSGSPAIATIGSSTGIVTGVVPGVSTITYAIGGCSVTMTVTVNAAPTAITGTLNVCVGSATMLSDATTGGAWAGSTMAVATIGTDGTVTGLHPGTDTISYTVGGCAAIAIVTVNPLPAAITGMAAICIGQTLTLADATSGGSWSSLNPGIASIGTSSGFVTALSAGTATILYTLPTGCSIATVVTVNGLPPAIYGHPYICTGHADTLFDDIPSGTWTSSDMSVATIAAGPDSYRAIVTPVGTGTVTITYSVGSGCTVTTTLGPVPAITGLHDVCAWGDTLHVSDIADGGIYTSFLATVTNLGGGEGTVAANAPGAVEVTYLMPWGCSTTGMLTVDSLPDLIRPTTNVCLGEAITLYDTTTGGTWSSSDVTVATIGSLSGVVTGLATGTANITYRLTATGCYVDTTIYVNPLSAPISGPASVCVGGTFTVSDGTSGGTWSSSTPGVAAVGGGTGVVTAVSAGTATITYTLPGGCYVIYPVTINGLPGAISGMATVCEGGTIPLADAPADGTWTSSDVAVATIGISSGVVTGVAATTSTATITYTTAAGCMATTSVTVYATTDACSPCILGPEYTLLGESGYITSDVGPGNYLIANDVVVSGDITFSNAVIQIAPGKKITVDIDVSKLHLDHCHLFGQCDMWQGIVLNVGGESGQIYVTNGTLIEDAQQAISVIGASYFSGYIVQVDNAIFNRNNTAIDIENYNSIYGYPFQVRNTVITSRDMQAAMTTALPYPANWPTTAMLKAPYSPPTVFDPPFNIDNPTGAPSGGAFKAVLCKNATAAFIGIKLNSVGTEDYSSGTIMGGIPVPDSYYELTVGDESDPSYQNLFDGLAYGVYATNSNVTCVNNAFAGMQPYEIPSPIGWHGGDGVYATVTDDGHYHKRLRVYTPAEGTLNNVFYGFRNGVECYNYFDLIGQNTYMINDSRGYLGNYGQYGYLVSSAKFDSVLMTYNTISNVNNGIAMWETHDAIGMVGGPASQLLGQVSASNNTVQASPSGYTFGMPQYVRFGIAIQNAVGTYGSAVTGSAHTDGNTLHDVQNGIFLNGIRLAQQATSSGNAITIQPRTSTPNALQAGINHSNCSGSVIAYNDVSGSTATIAMSDSLRAYYSGASARINVGCNTEESTGRGYEFFMHGLNSVWHDNTMTNNGKGYVLNNAVIGPQGAPGAPLQNEWVGTWGTDVVPPFQTYEINALSSSSILYVTPAALPDIYANGGNPALDRYNPIPGTTETIIPETYTTPPAVPCPARLETHFSTALFERITQQEVPYVTNVVPNNWIGQYQLWESIQEDSTGVDSSVVLQMFDTLATGSRYAYLTTIENYLADGDFTDATILLSSGRDTIPDVDTDIATGVRIADNSSATPIVENYVTFYKEYINYMNGELGADDSLQIMALAQLCPEINGAVVYKARVLYSFIYNDLSMFNDDSCVYADSTDIAEKHTSPTPLRQAQNGIQQYQLIPNPNDGSFTILQTVKDMLPVNAEILNAVGVSIYKADISFAGGVDNLKMINAVPGLYLLRLTDVNGQRFIIKFVVQ